MESPSSPSLPETFHVDFPLHDLKFTDTTDFSKSVSPANTVKFCFSHLIFSCFTEDKVDFEQIHSNLTRFPEILNRLDPTQNASPLHYAALKGRHKMVTFLLENGANVNIWNGAKSITPLSCAAAHGHLEVVQLLLKHGAEVNVGLDDPHADTPLTWAVRRGHFEVAKTLIETGKASQISAVVYSETPIHAAVIGGYPDILKLLLEAKGRADLSMGTGKHTPLHLAATGEYPNALECCSILLMSGQTDVNARDSNGRTPLHLAGYESTSPDPDIVRLLVSKGAEVDAKDKNEKTPLFYFLEDTNEALDCLEVLVVEGKCDVNAQDVAGCTALHLSAFKENAGAAELLLMSGADFSMKADGGRGPSALSLLLRRIPNTSEMIKKVLNNAVTLSGYDDQSKFSTKHNCKAKVDFNYVISSPRDKTNFYSHSIDETPTKNSTESVGTGTTRRNAKIWCRPSKYVADLERNPQPVRYWKETSKIKCLIDENQRCLLLHPVVHAFLSMKWHKARPIFISIFAFKFILVLLFSAYIHAPYIWVKEKTLTEEYSNSSSLTTEQDEIVTNNSVNNEIEMEGIPYGFIFMYCVIVALAVINGIMELAQLIRSPRRTFLSLEPWIFFSVLVIMVSYTYPRIIWRKADTYVHRTLAATGIWLAWIDVWVYMGRFPKFGLSIRIFFSVLHNFIIFLLPHFCLFAGFILAFSLLFAQNIEFRDLPHTVSKVVRIMGGDVNLPLDTFKTDKAYSYYANILMIYIYTAYISTVGIVLMNLLIGLAVHDIQGIYNEASMHRLTKQTILLNTLESNFSGKFIDRWVPDRFIRKYIMLFHPSAKSKSLIFKPFDVRDTRLSSDLKRDLVKLKTFKKGEKNEDQDQSRGWFRKHNMKNSNNLESLHKKMEEYFVRLERVLHKLEVRERHRKSPVRTTMSNNH